jgi:ABC-type antimicrobial peptide transport system permease subunit
LPAYYEKNAPSGSREALPTPPPAPRPIPNRYAWKLLSRDGGAIAAFVFGILGFIFSLVGAGLTIAIITAFLGIPFLLLGIAFLIAGVWVLLLRYQNAQKVVKVLQDGLASDGKIVSLEQNYRVRINGRYPWMIRYQFQVEGQDYEGRVSVLNQPGEHYQVGKAAWILYLPDAPKWNSLYPHP